MRTIKTIRWRWGWLVALGVMMLSLFPQFYLLCERGRDWNGAYAFCFTDEPAYASYVTSLIDGRPRRNDPYSRKETEKPLLESHLSIQFIPAYLIALPARLLNLSTVTTFILLAPLVAVATTLTVFWLLTLVSKDERFAALLTPFVLCLGLLVSGQGLFQAFLGQRSSYFYLPFLRRYTPAVVFPFFILFFAFMWKALAGGTRSTRFTSALLAGAMLVVCIYGHFYLWTTAVVWLALVGLLWLLVRPDYWQAAISSTAVVAFIAVSALIPYFFLLSERASTLDPVQAMAYTHVPDLWRPIELLALLIMIALAIGLRRHAFKFQDPRFLVTVAFALLPFAVFNQHVITGRSLQPMHFEQFVVNYTTLIAAALTIMLFFRAGFPTGSILRCLLIALSCVSFVWGIGETWIATRRTAQANIVRDEARPLELRLREIALEIGSNSGQTVVFTPIAARADCLPITAPQPVLWAPLVYPFSGLDSAEYRQRFFQFLYYSGVDANEFIGYYEHNEFARYALFGLDRVNPRLSLKYRPVTADELKLTANEYSNFVSNFDEDLARTPQLSYLVTAAGQPFDGSQLERWYQLDQGEHHGAFTLYRLTLRKIDK